MANLFTRKLSIIELIVVFVVLALLLVWISVITSRHPSRATARRVQDLSHLRQISTGVVSYAVDNEDYGPGLDSDGAILNATVRHRYQLMVDPDYLRPDVFVSVYDDEKTIWTTGALSSDHYSYAMLQLTDSRTRLSAWRLDAGPEAVLLSGRNSGADAGTGVESIQSEILGEWRGPVAWGDTHVTAELTHLIDTRYSPKGSVNIDDNLFEAEGMDDSYMIYEGD